MRETQDGYCEVLIPRTEETGAISSACIVRDEPLSLEQLVEVEAECADLYSESAVLVDHLVREEFVPVSVCCSLITCLLFALLDSTVRGVCLKACA